MNLTPIAPDLVPSALAVVRANLDVSAIPAFGRIADTFVDMATPTDTRASRAAALMLVCAVGMPMLTGAGRRFQLGWRRTRASQRFGP